MADLAAIEAQIEAIRSEMSRIDAQLNAICSLYETWNGEYLEAMAEKMSADAQDAMALDAACSDLYDQLSALYDVRDLAIYEAMLADNVAMTTADGMGYVS